MENDAAFANADFIPDGDTYPDRWLAAAAAFRDRHAGRIGISYGPRARETCDLFEPSGPAKGPVVFIQGDTA